MRIIKYARFVLAGILGVAAWAALATYLSFFGVWMSSVVESGDSAAFYGWAVAEIESKNKGNSAFVLIQDGKVAREYFGRPQESIDRDTLFPTASFSKWVAALCVMSLVEDDRLDLDAPVSRYLTRWQLPDSEFDEDQVTVRRLLSHTAGLTDGLGFGDYGAEEAVPAIEDELRSPRASGGENAEVIVGIEPGTEFRYSGGGYLVLELVVEEVSGVSYIDYAQSEILDRVGMSRSSFAFPGNLDNVSGSFHLDGTLAPTYRYASAAATGLASSAGDLAKLAQALLSPRDHAPLKAATIDKMREPHGFVMGAGIWGLGTILYAPTGNGDYVFGHDGANDPAINAAVRLNPETSDAVVLLVSGHPSLASNVASEWVLWQTGKPDFLQTERALRSAAVPILVGAVLIVLAVVLWWRRRASAARLPPAT